MKVGDKVFVRFADRQDRRLVKEGIGTIIYKGRKRLTVKADFMRYQIIDKIPVDTMKVDGHGDWRVKLYPHKDAYYIECNMKSNIKRIQGYDYSKFSMDSLQKIVIFIESMDPDLQE